MRAKTECEDSLPCLKTVEMEELEYQVNIEPTS